MDSLTTVRKLKEKGVEVYFQKENIYTLDSKGELLITIMSSLAQEESRRHLGKRDMGPNTRSSVGKVSMPYKHFLGYRKGENSEPEIVPEEAEVVRRIYRLFLEGQTPYGIKRVLEEEHVPTPAGKETWQTATILSILANEKYKGDALLQKTFCTDFLTKKMKVNEGRCRSITSKTATRLSLNRRSLTWHRMSWREGNKPAVRITARAALRESSSAAAAAGCTAARCGTPQTNTAASSGSATANSRESRNVIRRI